MTVNQGGMAKISQFRQKCARNEMMCFLFICEHANLQSEQNGYYIQCVCKNGIVHFAFP